MGYYHFVVMIVKAYWRDSQDESYQSNGNYGNCSFECLNIRVLVNRGEESCVYTIMTSVDAIYCIDLYMSCICIFSNSIYPTSTCVIYNFICLYFVKNQNNNDNNNNNKPTCGFAAHLSFHFQWMG